jgi:hypothetical protein
VIIEAIGLPQTFRSAVDEVAFTGRVVYIGYAKEPVAYETKLFVQKEIDILGSRNALPEDFREVIRMLEEHRFPVDEAVSAIVPLEAGAGDDQGLERSSKRLFQDHGAPRLINPSPETPEVGGAKPNRLIRVGDAQGTGKIGFRMGADPGHQQQPAQHDEGWNLFFFGLGLRFSPFDSLPARLDQAGRAGQVLVKRHERSGVVHIPTEAAIIEVDHFDSPSCTSRLASRKSQWARPKRSGPLP